MSMFKKVRERVTSFCKKSIDLLYYQMLAQRKKKMEKIIIKLHQESDLAKRNLSTVQKDLKQKRQEQNRLIKRRKRKTNQQSYPKEEPKEEIESLNTEVEELEKESRRLAHVLALVEEKIDQTASDWNRYSLTFIELSDRLAVNQLEEGIARADRTLFEMKHRAAVSRMEKNLEKGKKSFKKPGDKNHFEILEKRIEQEDKLNKVDDLNLDRFLEYSEEDILARDLADLQTIVEDLGRVRFEVGEALLSVQEIEAEMLENLEECEGQKETWISRKSKAEEQNNPDIVAQCQLRIDEFANSISTFETELPLVSANRKKVEDADAKLCLIIEKFKTCIEKKKQRLLPSPE